jgi:two-component system phosphate regulon sensor histidine kinase PhoR
MIGSVWVALRGAARRAAETRRSDEALAAVRLAEARDALASERGRAGAILAAMQEGIMVLDEDGRIDAVNPALREMLLLGADVRGKRPLEVVRHARLAELIEACKSDEIELGGVKPRRLLARASRIAGGGTLVAFFDVTDLRRLESLRRDFVANVSHELRTPVTAIRSGAETLRGVLEKDPAAAQRFAVIIERNAERLQDLLEDILDLSRIESRQYQLRPESLELGPFLALAASALRGRAEEKGIALTTETADGTPPVKADRRALEQVCANLIDNAIRYCGKGATVRLRAASRGALVEIAVVDDGPGIEERHLERLFERFYRVDPGRGRENGGTGLGLSIVKHLVEAMGGQVTVESCVGKGSTFRVVLPPG